ncbi:MAG: DUF4249 domain-containing protein [Prevotellaceae bacterium]|jgi:hypothetical protein|nr:DUF4249 domain-containing protein [Prevotellaceae bacterium]
MKKRVLLGAGMLLCAACMERMDLSTDYAPPRLVITGYVTTDTAVHRIKVSCTTPYFGTEQPRSYSSAEVQINGVRLRAVGDGEYVTDPAFFGVPGETYTLDVWVDFDDDGTPEHYSASAVMPALHRLDSITLSSVQLGTTKPPWMVIMHFQDLSGPNYFGAHLYINDTLYSNKMQRYFLNFFGEYVAEGQYIHFPVTSYSIREEMRWENDEPFYVYPRDSLTLELNTLSGDYFEFIRTARQEINGGNPLFAGPPANVPTNLSGGAVGIFGAYTISRKSLILPPKEEW